jgi:hypothetical protein
MTTNNETNTNKPSVGIKAWGTVPVASQKKPFVKREDDNLPRLKYLKFNRGDRDIRILTPLGCTFAARLTLPKSNSKFGDVIRSSWPVYDDCPIMTEMKVQPKERYTVLAIDRTDSLIKIFDMAPSIHTKIESLLAIRNKKKTEGNHVSPSDFDITIVYNPDALSPGDKYSVGLQDVEPLSEEDHKLIKDQVGGMDVLEKILAKQLIIPKSSTLREKLLSLGWDGKPMPKKVYKEDEKVETKTKLAEATDDDYDFTKAAAVESTETTEDAAE